jgi:hypothetical protein
MNVWDCGCGVLLAAAAMGFHDEKCFMMKNECDAGKSE